MRLLPIQGRPGIGRILLLTLVVGAHVFIISMLNIGRPSAREPSSNDEITLAFISFPASEIEPTQPSSAASPARARREPRRADPQTVTPTGIVGEPIAPSVDWFEQGQRVAAGIAVDEPSPPRAFGTVPSRPETVSPANSFAWDKVHTQRFEAVAEGGMLVRLSDNCQLVITPLPIGGCALGKQKARGDLFDELKAPVRLGDWKPASPP